ncbi:MAG: 50S ribosomal protein L17 [Armatimonadota bacterium]
MRHKVKRRTLGRRKSHRSSMLKNLVTSLIQHRKIETTQTRAKEISKLIDKLVGLAKKGDLSAKRQVFRVVSDRDAAKELFDVIAPVYKEGEKQRNSGYTRIIKLGFRKGDNAPVSIVEFV